MPNQKNYETVFCTGSTSWVSKFLIYFQEGEKEEEEAKRSRRKEEEEEEEEEEEDRNYQYRKVCK